MFSKASSTTQKSCFLCNKKYGTVFHEIEPDHDDKKESTFAWNKTSAVFLSKIIMEIPPDSYRTLLNSKRNWALCVCQECQKLTLKAQLAWVKIKQLVEEFDELKSKLKEVTLESIEAENGESTLYSSSSPKRSRRVRGQGGIGEELRSHFYQVVQKRRNTNTGGVRAPKSPTKTRCPPRSQGQTFQPSLQLVTVNPSDVGIDFNEIGDNSSVLDFDLTLFRGGESPSKDIPHEDPVTFEDPDWQHSGDDGEDRNNDTGSDEDYEAKKPKRKSPKKVSKKNPRQNTSPKRSAKAPAIKKPTGVLGLKRIRRLSESSVAIHKKWDNCDEDGTVYACEICGNQYASKRRFNIHYGLAHRLPSEKPLSCDICSKGFTQKTFLEYHRRAMHYEELGLIPHKCDYCGKILGSARAVKYHVQQRHTKQSRFTCEQCGQGFTQESYLKQHVEARHEGKKPFKCFFCPKAFTNISQRTNHVHTHTGYNQEKKKLATGTKRFECTICQKVFVNRSTFYRHKETHETVIHECPDCGKQFRLLENFRKHRRRHKRRVSCEICQKVCSNQVSLNNHMETHGSTIHECPTCKKQFKVKYRFDKHMKTHEENLTPIEERTCRLCQRVFAEPDSVRKHMKIHDPLYHLVTEAQIKNRTCTLCQRVCKTAYNLRKHMKTHDSTKFQKCPKCKKRIRNENYEAHLQKHENKDEENIENEQLKEQEQSKPKVSKKSKSPSKPKQAPQKEKTTATSPKSQPVKKEKTQKKKLPETDRRIRVAEMLLAKMLSNSNKSTAGASSTSKVTKPSSSTSIKNLPVSASVKPKNISSKPKSSIHKSTNAVKPMGSTSKSGPSSKVIITIDIDDNEAETAAVDKGQGQEEELLDLDLDGPVENISVKAQSKSVPPTTPKVPEPSKEVEVLIIE